MSDPKIGDRRPREGRCPTCDRPLCDQVYTHHEPILLFGPRPPPYDDWTEVDDQPDRCAGEPFCSGERVDWQARALAAETRCAADAATIARLTEERDAARAEVVRLEYARDHIAESDACQRRHDTLDAVEKERDALAADLGTERSRLMNLVSRVTGAAPVLPTNESVGAAMRVAGELRAALDARDRRAREIGPPLSALCAHEGDAVCMRLAGHAGEHEPLPDLACAMDREDLRARAIVAKP